MVMQPMCLAWTGLGVEAGGVYTAIARQPVPGQHFIGVILIADEPD